MATDSPSPQRVRHLVVVFGDQLDPRSSAWDGFDPARDRAWMAEVAGESTHVWSSKPRIAVFLAAMRHFAEALREAGVPLDYRHLDATRPSLEEELRAALAQYRPARLVVVEPGEWRILDLLERVVQGTGCTLDVRVDRHFLSTIAAFTKHASGRRSLRMESFYREERRRLGVLMEGAEPAGGRWNFDAENRAGFGREGPGLLVPALRHAPDALTQGVLRDVDRHFPDHPGSLGDFGWAVTPAQARASLDDFIANRLADFGHWQDAMWTGEPHLHHALLSSAMNLKLLDPRDVVAEAERAWREKRAPLASAEGFIRQIVGWREYVRGIYWTQMPGYIALNELDARRPLPGFYWTGDTDMHCVREVVTQTLATGYAHHIQRLMVTGLYALLAGIVPQQVHAWYLAVYVDAVEWVELPNTLGMSQYADGGLLGSKPYVASGKYIQRMSNYCEGCRFDPAQRTGDDACPFTTLYWRFLDTHRERLAANARMRPQVVNLQRLDREELAAIQRRGEAWLARDA